jgi:hypothetical protein
VLVGDHVKLLEYDTHSGIFSYFRHHHAAFFPMLLERDRTTFVRQVPSFWTRSKNNCSLTFSAKSMAIRW